MLACSSYMSCLVVTVHLGKGLYEQADRLKRDTAQGSNGRWLFGHYIPNTEDNLARGVRRQAQYDQAGSSRSTDSYGNGAAPTSPTTSAPTSGYGPNPSGVKSEGKECCGCQVGPPGRSHSSVLSSINLF